jgi:lambda family phage tail tape measure protein
MADQNIVIRVQVVGGSGAARDLDAVGKKAKEVDKTAQLLKRTFAFLGGVALVKETIQLVDTYTNLQNRLKIVTSSTAELAVVQDRLFNIAQETRQSYEATVELYARTSSATKTLGLSTEDTLRFTELLNKAVTQSGASANESENAIRQLTQALGSGRLGGDELRSVLEQLPTVADLIAQQLGVTRGELRALGAQGVITPQVIVQAFLNAQQQIENGFGKLVPTLSQGFIVLKNSAVQFFGSIAQSSGISEAFARGLIFLAVNIDTVIRVILTLANTIIVILVGKAINTAIVAIQKFIIAFTFSNFITATIQVLILLINALIAFSDQLNISSSSAATLADFFVSAFQSISAAAQTVLIPVFETITEFLQGGQIEQAVGAADAFDFLVDQPNKIASSFRENFSTIAFIVADEIDKAIFTVTRGTEIIVLAFQVISAPIQNVLVGINNAVAPFLNTVLGALEAIINKSSEFLGIGKKIQLPRLEQQQPTELINFFTERAKILAQPQTGASDFVKGIFAGADQRASNRLQDEAKRKAAEADAINKLGIPGQKGGQPLGKDEIKAQGVFKETLRDLAAEIELLQGGNKELEVRKQLTKVEDKINRPLSTSERSQLEPLFKQVEALRTQSKVLQDITGPEEERIKRQEALNGLLERGLITQDQYNFALQASANPLQKTLNQLDQEIQLLQLSEQAYGRRQQQLQIEQELGRSLTTSEAASLESRQAQVESLKAQNALLDEIRGPQIEYAQNIAALDALQLRVGLSAGEYNTQLDKIRLQYLNTQTTAAAGFEAGLIQIRQQFGDVSDLAQNTVVNAFKSAEDAIVQFVETGKFSFSGLVDSILADITRLAVRQAITAPLANLLGGSTGGGGGGTGGLIGGAIGLLGGLFGGGGGGTSNSAFGDFGLATGGRFVVGGSGGADSQFIPLRLTPGELVEVTPPGKSSGVTVNYFIQTQDADSFKRSQSQIFRDTQTAMQRNTRKLT